MTFTYINTPSILVVSTISKDPLPAPPARSCWPPEMYNDYAVMFQTHYLSPPLLELHKSGEHAAAVSAVPAVPSVPSVGFGGFC